MMQTIRITTGRENVVIESLVSKIKSSGLPIKSLFHPEELRGYVFIEGEANDIEATIKGVPHIRGLINKEVKLTDLERFMVSEQQVIEINTGDIVEIIGGPFKGEKGRITRVDDTKQEVTVEFLEAAIPIPVTVPINSVTIHEKKSEE